jgi:bifunctional non-homologous end joining protein LigD
LISETAARRAGRATPSLLQPDLCIFDLDPSREAPITLRQAALTVRALLDELALPSFVKTSGSKGR